MEVGRDALGNMQRISNALARIPEELKKTQQKMENVQCQLATAKEEVEKPFVKEAELLEKLERLAELNVLLNMDEKSPAEAVGLDEEDREAVQDIPERDMEENIEAQIQKLPLISDHTEPEGALNGLSRAVVEETVLCYAQAQIEAAGLDGDVELLGARVCGSRTREGLYREDSDIDVVVSYAGDIREDAFFNLLHGEDFCMAGIPIDMNPISLEKTGTLEEYLERAEKHLDSREVQLNSGRAVPEIPGSMEAGQPAENGERRSVLAALKEKQSAMERRENGAENLKEYKKRGQEL